jgi:hypothetical protein
MRVRQVQHPRERSIEAHVLKELGCGVIEELEPTAGLKEAMLRIRIVDIRATGIQLRA